MGLSEREQQLLDEMERRLYQSEADVMQAAPSRSTLNLRSLTLGVIVLLAGVAALIAGVAMQQMWIGLLGFVVMFAGALLAFSRRDEHGKADEAAPISAARSEKKRQTASFGDRMQQRWDKRMDGRP